MHVWSWALWLQRRVGHGPSLQQLVRSLAGRGAPAKTIECDNADTQTGNHSAGASTFEGDEVQAKSSKER